MKTHKNFTLVLECGTCQLRPITAEMFKALCSQGEYQGLKTLGHWPNTVIQKIIQKDLDAYKKYPELLIWSVWLISNENGVIVGDIGFKGPPDPWGSVEIGYEIDAAYHNKGYATQSVGRLCEFAFSKHVEKIQAEIHKDNRASLNVILKNNFSAIRSEGQYVYYEKVPQ